jgi:hypothetical protein
LKKEKYQFEKCVMWDEPKETCRSERKKKVDIASTVASNLPHTLQFLEVCMPSLHTYRKIITDNSQNKLFCWNSSQRPWSFRLTAQSFICFLCGPFSGIFLRSVDIGCLIIAPVDIDDAGVPALRGFCADTCAIWARVQRYIAAIVLEDFVDGGW